jgi:branched-subunit amino acid aminotransferase/4-amino-4-deoxychorismate lyase
LVFYDSEDQLLEGARSNIFVKIKGRWYTPPLALGILPGVMRTVMMRGAPRPTHLESHESTEVAPLVWTKIGGS